MSKEKELLISKIEFYKSLINYLDYLNFETRSNNYNEKIVEYQNLLESIYKRIQELKGEEK